MQGTGAMQGEDVAGLLEAGRLSDAVSQCAATLKAKPADQAARTLYAELLCLSGAFDRAEAQLAIVAQQTVDRPIAIARLRHLIRAATAREAWFRDQAVPALLQDPTPMMRCAIDLSLALRDRDAARVAAVLERGEAERPHLCGTLDGTAFQDLRDVDDRSAWMLEVMTQDGGYLWVDWATVAGLRLSPVVRPVDLLWREARLALQDGRVAEIVLPAQYAGVGEASDVDEAQRLSQRTDWHSLPGGAYRGAGQRVFLVDDDAYDFLQMSEIVLTAPVRAHGPDGEVANAEPDAQGGAR